MSKYYLGAKAAADFQAMRAAHNAERVDKRPMRKRTVAVAASSTKFGIFDGERDGRCYTGHLLDKSTGAASGTAIQWMFLNDEGEGDLLEEDDIITLVAGCPSYLSDDDDWANSSPKYIAERPHKAIRLRYKSMDEDYLICHSWDGTTEGADSVYVAKPWLLRRSTEARTGYSYSYTNDYTRTSTKAADSSTEDQTIVPSYVVDDEIWAVPARTGVDVDDEPVMLIDLNLDARAWAAE